MSSFPKLKTGAVAQYPAVRETRFATEIHTFLDRAEQRYRDRSTARRRWLIDLSRLDEVELSALTRFFDEQQGRLGRFDFEDPWSGLIVADCRFDQDEIVLRSDGELDSAVQVVIIEPVS